ncbi:MAG: ATP-binding protein [Bacteroidetes bacterium]|nr:ATP-binding protein [Bacteroidota bacterium]
MQRWSLPIKLERYLANNNKEKALYLLSRITSLNSQAFVEHDTDYLRFVGRFRTELLIDWLMYREALAWVCLECELYPDNKEAKILRESLKRHILNVPRKQEEQFIPTEQWDGVAGMYELKAIIERDIIRPIMYWDLYEEYGVTIPHGFLFYGPPGCGKTFFAEKIAERLGFEFINVRTSDIASPYVHGTQKEIRRIFDDARERVPVVLFFDEIEAMVPSRKRTDVSFHYKSEVDEFLGQLNKKLNEGLVIIGATNYLNSIDDAILRAGRFDKKIFIGPPDLSARAEGFRMHLNDFPQKNIRYDFIAEMSQNFTFADIELVCDDIKRSAIEQSMLILNTDYVGRFVSKYKPSLNKTELSKYM